MKNEINNELNFLTSESFLLVNGFIKTNGQFGEYFLHEKYELFRCWFYNEKLQIGKKDSEKDICVWITTIDNKKDFVDLFRILTKQKLNKLSESYSEEEVMNILKERDLHNCINMGGNNTWIDRPEWFEQYKKKYDNL